MKRLFEDPALSSELRGELSRSQAAGREYDVHAKLPQLREAFENLQPTQTELIERGVASGGTPAGGLIGVPFSVKLTVSVLVLGAAVYLAWPDAQSSHSHGQTQPSAAVQPIERVPAPDHRVPEPAAALAVEPAPTRDVAPQPSAPKPAPAATVRSNERSSRREIAQLVRIRSLLEHNPVAAYQLARQSEQEFPHGLLGEERRALQVEALAKSGKREAAERKAREFFGRYPQSPLRERVEAALRR
jgi:hypothetical protein